MRIILFSIIWLCETLCYCLVWVWEEYHTLTQTKSVSKEVKEEDYLERAGWFLREKNNVTWFQEQSEHIESLELLQHPFSQAKAVVYCKS